MKFVSAILFLLAPAFCYAQVSSITNGYWSDTATWDTGVVPASTDSVIIGHEVVFTNKIVIDAGGSVTIYDGSTLCGQDTFLSRCGGNIYNIGTLKAGVLFITDGINDGWLYAQYYFNVAPCLGPFVVGNYSVGNPVNCNLLIATEDNQTEKLKLFPNPVNDYLNITGAGNEPVELIVFDLNAKKIIEQTFQGSVAVNTSQLTNGIYYYELRKAQKTISNGKFIRN